MFYFANYTIKNSKEIKFRILIRYNARLYAFPSKLLLGPGAELLANGLWQLCGSHSLFLFILFDYNLYCVEFIGRRNYGEFFAVLFLRGGCSSKLCGYSKLSTGWKN